MKVLLSGMEWLPDLPGGLNRYFHGLIEALPRVGVSGTALVSHLSGKNPAPTDGSAPIRVVPMAPEGASLLQRLRGSRVAARDALINGAELVNVHFALYALSWARKLSADVPLVVHFHGPWADEVAAESAGMRGYGKSIFARWLENSVYRKAMRIVTLSNAFADIVRERYGIPEERIRVIPGGVNLRAYFDAPSRDQARDQLGWPSDRPILVSVRRLVRRVGIEGLIEALQQVKRIRKDVLLYIAGEGPLGPELIARAADAGLSDHVKFLGRVPECQLPLVYAAADLSIVPTVKLEGFGMVTAESLAAGTPVLGTPIGGTPEILRGLEPGLVFESLAPESIANRILVAINGGINLPDAVRCRMHAAKYDWTSVIHEVRTVFDECLKGTSR